MKKYMNNKRTPLFLMANLGSEVTRLFAALEKKDAVLTQGAYERACKILTEVMTFPEMQNRNAEFAILKNVLDDLALAHNTLSIKPQHLKAYFMPFALRVMSSR